jgi:hypothetical protein
VDIAELKKFSFRLAHYFILNTRTEYFREGMVFFDIPVSN